MSKNITGRTVTYRGRKYKEGEVIEYKGYEIEVFMVGCLYWKSPGIYLVKGPKTKHSRATSLRDAIKLINFYESPKVASLRVCG